jgi:hypothetical protein
MIGRAGAFAICLVLAFAARAEERVGVQIVGEADVPPERLAAKLVEIAERFKQLETAAAAQPGDDATIAALKADAQEAIQDGQLGEADDFLAGIEKIQTAAFAGGSASLASLTDSTRSPHSPPRDG